MVLANPHIMQKWKNLRKTIFPQWWLKLYILVEKQNLSPPPLNIKWLAIMLRPTKNVKRTYSFINLKSSCIIRIWLKDDKRLLLSGQWMAGSSVEVSFDLSSEELLYVV